MTEHEEFGQGQDPLEVKLRKIQELMEEVRELGESHIALGGEHTEIGNNVLSYVDISETRRKMLINTVNQMGWTKPRSLFQRLLSSIHFNFTPRS